MKARPVKGMDPDGALADNAARMVATRLDELVGFMPRAAEPAEVVALHDMRIAAKRLRYLLELFASCFGPYAVAAARRVKALQDLLGEIHDCDLLLPRVEGMVAELRERDAAEVARMAGDASELDPALTATMPHADRFAGLESLAVHVRARRLLLFDRFLAQWRDLQRQGFQARLEFAITERSAAPDANRAGDHPDPLPSTVPST